MSSQVPATKTPVSPADVFAALRAQWIALWGDTPSRGSLLVLVAQWALETDRGAKCIAWNLGNVRWTTGYPSDFCAYETTEVIKGKTVHVIGRFRAFDTLEAGARDYLATLRTEFTKAWAFVLSGDPAGFAHAAKEAGYYTGSEATYAADMTSLFKEFEGELPDLETEVDTSDTSILKG
jgi:flagellum-specific peptidoglycan hydrolase FlgJ